MRAHRRWIPAAAIALLIAAAVCEGARAIPAFARRHKVSCTTCHAPFPRLKPYGDEFAGNGFAIPEEENDRDYIIAGDDLLRLNRHFPIAVRIDAYGVWEEDADVDVDLQTPWGLKLLSGGTVYKNIGYYFYFYMSERGEVAGIEDAYVHFNDLFGQPLDLMVGQFQTSDPLMKRELRLTYEDYVVYKTRIGAARVNLAYDRGVILTYGVAATGTDLVAMLVNGNGKDEAGDDHHFDSDSRKNYGLRISQAIGEFASVGGFFYRGEEEITDLEGTDAEPYRWVDEVIYYGPDLSLSLGPVDFTGQYLMRTDTEPVPYTAWNLTPPAEDVKTEGWVAELVFSPQLDRSRWVLTLLYNRVDSDLKNTLELGEVANPDYETLTAGCTYLVARNLRVLGEFTRDLEHERNRAALGLVGAF